MISAALTHNSSLCEETSFIFEEKSLDKYIFNFEYAKECLYHPLFNMALSSLFVYVYLVSYRDTQWWKSFKGKVSFAIGMGSLGYFLGHFISHFLIKYNFLSETDNFRFVLESISVIYFFISIAFLSYKHIPPFPLKSER
jgi:hypothetical protein